MKILKLSLAFFIIQLFCLHQISAENLNAVRVIVNGEIITEFDIQKRAYEAFRIAAQKYSESELESKKQEIIVRIIKWILKLTMDGIKLVILSNSKDIVIINRNRKKYSMKFLNFIQIKNFFHT